MKFKVKKDLVFYLINILIISFLFFYIFLYLTNKNFSDLFSLCIFLLLGLLFLPIFFYSYYLLDEESLNIRFGFKKMIIPYKDILGFEKVNRSIASISMSKDRIEIKYRNNNSNETHVDISPVDRDLFLNMLRKKLE